MFLTLATIFKRVLTSCTRVVCAQLANSESRMSNMEARMTSVDEQLNSLQNGVQQQHQMLSQILSAVKAPE